MNRRGFIAVAATVPFAGCGMLGGNDDGVSASLDANSDDINDFFSESFEASAGDAFDITIEAGDDGAEVGLVPDDVEADGEDFEEQTEFGWGWSVGPNEEETDTIEIEEDDSYGFIITQGQAEAEASRVD